VLVVDAMIISEAQEPVENNWKEITMKSKINLSDTGMFPP